MEALPLHSAQVLQVSQERSLSPCERCEPAQVSTRGAALLLRAFQMDRRATPSGTSPAQGACGGSSLVFSGHWSLLHLTVRLATQWHQPRRYSQRALEW